jgi:hypothetical protein
MEELNSGVKGLMEVLSHCSVLNSVTMDAVDYYCCCNNNDNNIVIVINHLYTEYLQLNP